LTGDPQATANPLALLLQRLGPSPDAAGDAYESLRRLLHRFFEVRGCHDAAALCDEVLDRVARRLADGIDIANLPAYAHGVARLVHLEARRRPAASPLEALPTEPAAAGAADADPAGTCLDGCLDRLDDATRQQVIAYYTSDGRGRIDGRRELARQLGVSATALRLRMLRTRLALERCVEACLARAASRNTRGGRNTSP
jgi:DNA-directed RNA polymerase specialized sigma24 family protein